jgi:hypothetical protein
LPFLLILDVDGYLPKGRVQHLFSYSVGALVFLITHVLLRDFSIMFIDHAAYIPFPGLGHKIL